MCCILMFAVYYDMVHPHYVLLSLRSLLWVGFWPGVPPLWSSMELTDHGVFVGMLQADVTTYILDMISDLFWREAPQKCFRNGNPSENEKEKKCKDAYSRYYRDLYINPCKLEFLILLNPSSVSPDADNITRCTFRNLCYEIYDQETMTQKRVTLQRSYTKFK